MKQNLLVDADALANLRGVVFDLDDTLLTHGKLSRNAYNALWDLHACGLHLIAATGRPSGWGALISQQWPIDAAVTENGAIFSTCRSGRVETVDRCSEDERRSRKARLVNLINEIAIRFPQARLTDDNVLRRSDAAWDIREKESLAEETVESIRRKISQMGAKAIRSSIHLHATYDNTSKAEGITELLTQLGETPEVIRTTYAFIGDSTNDASCFSLFAWTWGVANIEASLSSFPVPPRWITRAPMGEGFCEMAKLICDAKR